MGNAAAAASRSGRVRVFSADKRLTGDGLAAWQGSKKEVL
ncbi:MAG: hypothetical protein AVDCRST_MAG56-898 [uncultured Cytophagales bacterium]|uniref:Uncharacterized protein n=1 Tax=uncultured Cytophagales bacterium TaxID=158755 RepID=A0A6J4HSE3_9SPHI|nr:MAG: hypothetical protein AVDCRST_MAG56-898 [uncultured Cytophagales bacterium]